MPIADLISSVLRGAGYERNLNPTNENSPVAFVGAKVISSAYGVRIRPAGFATAMRNRDRAKKSKADFDKRFPQAARTTVL
jgi:hypothetical protein